jgi:hypothetical protein
MNAKATLYLDPKILKAAKIKAAHTEKSLSYLVNEALKLSLQESAADYGVPKASQMSESSLTKPMVAEIVEQKLLELFGDSESDLKLSAAMKKILAKRYHKKDLISADQAAAKLGIKW